ncbi:MAG: TonB-dependent siderophore receptor [Gemmatimonadaceae bacterium]
MRTRPLCLLVLVATVPAAVEPQAPAAPRDTIPRPQAVQSAVEDTAPAKALGAVRVVAARRSVYADAVPTSTATKTPTPLRDVPQSVTTVPRDLITDLSMQSMADVVRLVPGVTMGQGEGHRDQPTIRGNNTTADFFVDGVRDDVQYFRDVYNVERVEALKGSNAMIFGRGGGGGVLNRVTKEPQWTPVRELTLQGGSFDNKRASLDVGQGLSHAVAGRLNGMFERSGFFRHDVTLRRVGVNPTLTFAPGAQRTRLTLGYEYFTDHRTVDRGIPSFGGRPLETDIATFFGDPAASHSEADVHLAAATLTRELGAGLHVRNRAHYAYYDKFYQNVFPGAVNAAGDQVSITAYNSGMLRRNLFNQTDVTYETRTGSVRHTLLVGAEAGRQSTDNVRNTGYFDNTSTSISVAVADPTISAAVTFRPSATDPNNHVVNTVGSVYAQDQVALSARWQLVAGLRYERFDVRYHDNRSGSTLRRADHMVSPRTGLVFKPAEAVSLYATQSVSFLPSAGDQFSSLTDITKALQPERFTNYEVGTKWGVAGRLALTAAAYRLDRTNTSAPDPTTPGRILQTGSQRTTGVELGVNGSVTPAWEIALAYANQNAFITRTTTAAPTGARVPLLPRHTLSVWNRYQVARRLALGLGVDHQSEMFAAIDNKVTVPSFVEFNGAVYMTLARNVRVQAYLENLSNVTYYVTAHNNNNISPGSPRALRLALVTGF